MPGTRSAVAQVVVLARWPAPGRCKTRLAAGLGRSRAARIQQRLALHALAAVREALRRQRAGQGERAQLVLAVAGLGPRAARRWGLELQVDRVVLQGTGGLGSRLQRQLVRAAREGCRRIVLLGSDLPALEPADLLAALRALETAPWVLGPARDGGYWLIGSRGPHPSPFCGRAAPMAWGSDTVLASTLELAAQHGIQVPLLPLRADLDRPDDLRAWR